MKTVHELRKEGFKVQVIHFRISNSRSIKRHKYVASRDITGKDIYAHGGYTVVNLTSPDGKDTTGEAQCDITDVYNRETGRSIALQRALDNLAIGNLNTFAAVPSVNIDGNLPQPFVIVHHVTSPV